MEYSKLPFRYWFVTMHLLTGTQKSFSASELQRQLGHKRFQPIWEMLHKLRNVMGKRDSKYRLSGQVELDNAFITTLIPDGEKDEKLKRSAGYQAQRPATGTSMGTYLHRQHKAFAFGYASISVPLK
jgi:hypothetical protein